MTSALLLVTVLLSVQDTTQGKVVYQKWCAGCHGDQGAGDGEGARHMLPTPRDFTGAIYQIRSTASGNLPTDADLMRSIDEGLPGTAMPGWKTRLSDRERRDVIAYLKTFSTFFSDTTLRPQALDFGKAPGGGADAVRIGRQFYDSIGCRKCHGDQGRGDGPSSPTLKDDAGHPIFAANLHENWRFNGGGTVEDIYHRLRTGLDGTPMPSFSDLLEQKFLTDAELWHVAQYVRSLSPEDDPAIRDVIHAPRIKGALPRSPDDSAWSAVDAYWFPLVGQIIRKNRWFAPVVSGVWVKTVHTGDSIAMRVVWDDRSASPDTAWLTHVRRVMAVLANDDSSAAQQPAPWPDQLAVQFPVTIPSGMERPYFLMGGTGAPVYQWRWSSSSRGAAVPGLARGIERFDPIPGGTPVGAQAVYDHGQWRVVFSRALATLDTASQLPFRTNRAIPVAFFAWDGSNGEYGTRMGISTWYFLALDEPVPASVFISPVLAMALTLGLGLLVVWRAQRKTSFRRQQ